MGDLSTALIEAVGNVQKEQNLQDWLLSDFAANTNALAAEVADESKPFQGRQMASIYLKNALNGKSAATAREKQNRWKALDAHSRAPVKEHLLNAMRSPTPGIPKISAMATAEIAAVELPYQQWPEFVPALMENVTSQQMPELVKLASLECLGFCAERITEVEEMIPEVPALQVATVDSMLTTIVDGVQPVRSDKMRLAALNALKNSLAFVKKNMDVKSERDFIFNAICEATRCNDAAVRMLAYQCLDNIAELYYEKLPDYMTAIFELTTASIGKDPDETVQAAAMEFWNTLAIIEQQLMDEEAVALEDGQPLDRPACQQYVKAAMDSLVPLLLETLTKQNEDAESDEEDLQSFGATCLESISQTLEAAVVPAVIPFVQANIVSENWRLRDAGIVAFSCILEGPDTSVVGQYVSDSIPVLMNAFSDQSMNVRDSATHCVSKICERHIQAIPMKEFNGVIHGLIAKLQEYPRVANHACSAIFNIAKSTKRLNPEVTDQESNPLSAPMLPILQALLAASDRADAIESNLRVTSFLAVAELISASARDVQHIFRDFLPVVVDRIEKGLQLQCVSNDDQEEKAQLLGLLAALVTVLFQRMDKKDVLPHVDRIMQLLLQMFQLPNATCHEEAFMAVGAIASAMEEDFTKYMQAFTPFLLAGIRNFQAETLCKVAVGVVVDICSGIGGQIQPFCDDIMGALMECLRDGSVQREIKPVVIACFGDVAMAICGAYEPYLPTSVMLLMQASTQRAPADDDELIDFVNSLRLSILEAYSGIIIGLSDGSKLHLFVTQLPNIMQFLEFLSREEALRDDDVLVKAVALIGDIGQQLGNQPGVRQQVQQQFVVTLITEAATCSDPSGKELATWTHGVLAGLGQ